MNGIEIKYILHTFCIINVHPTSYCKWILCLAIFKLGAGGSISGISDTLTISDQQRGPLASHQAGDQGCDLNYKSDL